MIMKKLIRVIALVLIVMWVYGIFAYMFREDKIVDTHIDNCQTNSQLNNCFVISTDK